MSYIQEKTTFKKRRHPTRHVTPEELLAIHNRQVDDCNDKIAAAQGRAVHWQEVAEALAAEGQRLQAEIARLRKTLGDVLKVKQLGDAKGVARKALEKGS